MMDGRTWGHVEYHACKAGHARGRNECVLRILTSTCSADCYDPLQALGSMLRSVDKVPCVQGLFRPGATLGALNLHTRINHTWCLPQGICVLAGRKSWRTWKSSLQLCQRDTTLAYNSEHAQTNV